MEIYEKYRKILKFYLTHSKGKKTTKSDLHFPSLNSIFFSLVCLLNFHKSGKKIPARQPLSIECTLWFVPLSNYFGVPVLTPTFMELKYINMEITGVFESNWLSRWNKKLIKVYKRKMIYLYYFRSLLANQSFKTKKLVVRPVSI